MINVLFVSSGKSGDVGIVVRNQGESLRKAGINLDFLTIDSGFWGYLKAVYRIRRKYNNGKYDLVHAHYGLSAISASLAGNFPLVVSLMGSDAYLVWPFRFMTKILSRFRWGATIVKTEDIKDRLHLYEAVVIPNGVDIETFKPIDKNFARKHLNINQDDKVAVFISPKTRPEKNLPLAKRAVSSVKSYNVNLLHIHDTPNSEIPFYLNAADLILVTSSREGSVNVIKEAMACNCPIVATDVGDISWVIGTTEGCVIADPDENDLSNKITLVLESGRRTDGRNRIISLGLNSGAIAERITMKYNEVLERHKRKTSRSNYHRGSRTGIV